MSLLLSLPIRITLAGDGVSKKISFDLKTTIVQFMDGTLGTIPAIPDKLISYSIGGPDISPEYPEYSYYLAAELKESILSLNFIVPPQKTKEHYTIEFIFGYEGITENVPTGEQPTQV